MIATTASGYRRVVAGGLAWGAGVSAWRPGWPEAFLALGALVVVPLGLGLVEPVDVRCRNARPWRAADRLGFPSALALLATFGMPAGLAAAVLTLPWLVVTVLVALHGLIGILRGPRAVSAWVVNAGLVYLAVGGAWAVAARAGLRPLGFPDVIVVMTAVHFHYAGFALPVLAGLAAGAVGGVTPRVAAVGAAAGVPLVAAGITDAQLPRGLFPAHALEVVAASELAAAAVLVGLMQLRLAARPGRPAVARGLLAVSGLSTAAPMCLALLYATGAHAHVVRVELATMFRYHGAVNAIGFALAGLLAWRLSPPGRDRPSPASEPSSSGQSVPIFP